MNQRVLRRVALAVAAVVALVVVGALVFTATFDVNRYKPQIVDAVKQRTGRTLTFDGDLSLALFPRLAVRLPATTLSEPGRDAVFARLRSAQASVALLPLLRKEIEVDGVRIDGLQATVVKQKDGTTNIDDLLKPKGGAAPPPGGSAPPPTSSGAATTIGEVQLKDADVTWRDLGAGRTLRLSGLDARAGRYAPGARMPIDAKANVTSSEPAFAAKVNLAANVEWSDRGDLRALRDLALKADGTLKQQPVALEAKAEQLVAANDALDVRALKVNASGKGEGGAPFELQLVAPRIEAGPQRAAGERIELTLARRGAEPLDAKVIVDGVSGTAERLQAASVKASGSSRSAQRTTRFDLTTALAASVKDRTVRFERATGEVVVDDPAVAKTPLRLPITASGAIDGVRETVGLQFETRGEGLSGRGTLNATGFSAPRIAFDIDAQQVDADRYFLSAPAKPAGAPAAAAPSAPATPPAAAADTKVDLAALRDLHVNGAVRIARLRAKGTDFEDLRATVKAEGGRLDVAPLALRVLGGTVNGRLGVDARNNQVSTAGSVNGLQLRQLRASLGGRAAVEGSANGTFDLAAAGATTNRMKRALAGTLAVEVRDGALVGVDLGDLIGTAQEFMQSRGRQKGALDENKRTPFSQLSASVRIRDGVASNDDLKAKSATLDITGRGTLNVVTTELDYTLQAQVLPGASPDRGALRSLAGLTVPVRITGPVGQPSYAVDWAPVAAQALAKRATGSTGAPSVDRVIEGLSDLLKRRK